MEREPKKGFFEQYTKRVCMEAGVIDPLEIGKCDVIIWSLEFSSRPGEGTTVSQVPG